MAVRDRADIAASLERKGFALRQGKKDHDFYYFEWPGLTTAVFTKLSRGSSYKTYGHELLDEVKRQLKLTTPQLLELIDCPMAADDYVKILIDSGVIDKRSLDEKRASKRANR